MGTNDDVGLNSFRDALIYPALPGMGMERCL